VGKKDILHLSKDGSDLAACGWSGIGIRIAKDETKVSCKKCKKRLDKQKSKELQMRLNTCE